MSEYRKELEKYLTMPNAHINCAENTSMALTDALGIGGGLEDARYIDLYADYTRLLDQGEKVSYAVAVLSEKYSVSERKVYALVKRFQSDCKTLAV